MEQDHKSIMELARDCDLAPSFIQNLRSGKQKDIKLSNFINLCDNLGYEVILKNKSTEEEIHLHKLTR